MPPEIEMKDKATIYADALIGTLTETAEILGDPDINSALAALTFSQAYLIAKITDRNLRRLAEKQVNDSLAKMVSEQVNARILKDMVKGAGQ